MITPNSIHKIKLSAETNKPLEKEIQANELNYLSAGAFEQFNVTDADIDVLHGLIDKKVGASLSTSFNSILVSALCGLFIGISIFFVIFQKSKTHASVFQFIETETNFHVPLNKVMAADTVFPELKIPIQKPVEHYNSNVNQLELPIELEAPEPMQSKPIDLQINNIETTDDIIYSFSPNAPVVFISNLKITNYRLYYFKQNQVINLSINTGLAAQYENNSSVENTRLAPSDNYYAHKIIQQAMRLFSSKHYSNCIDELNMLYDFNSDDANAQFYLGMCFYITGKYKIAQTYFIKNSDNQNNIFHQESNYYFALCLLHTNQKNKAISALQSIIIGKGFYSDRAKEVLSAQPN